MSEENIYGQSLNHLYSARGEHAGPHEATLNAVPGSNVHDPLYQVHVSRAPEDPYTMNPTLHVDNSHSIHAVRDPIVEDSQNYTQHNIFIYDHLAKVEGYVTKV